MENIQEIVITSEHMVRIKVQNSRHQKDTYISVSVLVDLLDDDFERISNLPENKADKEHYIRKFGSYSNRGLKKLL